MAYPVEGVSQAHSLLTAEIAGRSFHNGCFVQRLRQAAASCPGVSLRRASVRRLLNGTWQWFPCFTSPMITGLSAHAAAAGIHLDTLPAGLHVASLHFSWSISHQIHTWAAIAGFCFASNTRVNLKLMHRSISICCTFQRAHSCKLGRVSWVQLMQRQLGTKKANKGS